MRKEVCHNLKKVKAKNEAEKVNAATHSVMQVWWTGEHFKSADPAER